MNMRRKRLTLTGIFILTGLLSPMLIMLMGHDQIDETAKTLWIMLCGLSQDMVQLLCDLTNTRSIPLLTVIFALSQTIIYGGFGYFLSLLIFRPQKEHESKATETTQGTPDN